MRQFLRLGRWAWLIVFCVVTALVVNAVPQPAVALGGWTSTALTPTNRASVFPDVAVDATGTIHVVYAETAPDFGGERLIRYTRNTGNGWSAAVTLSGDVAVPSVPRIATATLNGVVRVHVVFEGRTNATVYTSTRIWGVTSGDGGANWSGPVVVADGTSFSPALSVDPTGTAHVAWGGLLGEGPNGVNINIFYANNPGGGWGNVQQIASRENGNSYNSFPAINHTVLNGVITLHVLFMGQLHGTGERGKVVFSTRREGNGGWTGIERRSGEGANFPKLATNGATIYAAWQGLNSGDADFEPFTTRSTNNGATWEGPTSRGTNTGDLGARPGLARAGDNSVLLAWDEQAQTVDGRSDPWFNYSTDGANWQGAQPLFQRTGQALEIEVAGSCANFHAVWHDNANGVYQIWYGQTGDPRAGCAGAPLPTPTPPAPTPMPTPPPANAPPTGSFDFAAAAFRTLWTRTDSLVERNQVQYSWLWGPRAFTSGVNEPYVQSPNGTRLVQYFDKSRMEINQPGAPQGPFYVTNGRLADELITGILQLGDAQYEQRNSAPIAVAGDPSNTFPLYRDLRSVYRLERAGNRANQIISRAPDGAVQILPLPSADNDPSMLIVQRVGMLGIPAIFWNFMNQSGNVVENGSVVNATPLFDWRYVIGEPLTEAYWTVVNVGGKPQGVLMQAFERRVLTYTPTNSAPYQVEMGNIGRHYFEWRYGVRP